MIVFLLPVTVGGLACANGANDNFKGVASLRNLPGFTYRRALLWAAAFTFAGSLASAFLARGLLPVFSGTKILPNAALGSPLFAAAGALGAAGTAALASLVGRPISTTHLLMGGLGCAGIAAAGWGQVNFVPLLWTIAAPLLLSPFLSLMLTAGLAPLASRWMRHRRTCICAAPPAPVSTTHVSVGALFGLTARRSQARAHLVRDILLAWLFTAPVGAILALAAFLILRTL